MHSSTQYAIEGVEILNFDLIINALVNGGGPSLSPGASPGGGPRGLPLHYRLPPLPTQEVCPPAQTRALSVSSFTDHVSLTSLGYM